MDDTLHNTVVCRVATVMMYKNRYRHIMLDTDFPCHLTRNLLPGAIMSYQLSITQTNIVHKYMLLTLDTLQKCRDIDNMKFHNHVDEHNKHGFFSDTMGSRAGRVFMRADIPVQLHKVMTETEISGTRFFCCCKNDK